MHFKGKDRDSVLGRQLLGAEAKVYDEIGHSRQEKISIARQWGQGPRRRWAAPTASLLGLWCFTSTEKSRPGAELS